MHFMKFHNYAMRLVDEADSLKRRGRDFYRESDIKLQEALIAEETAVLACISTTNQQPARAILCYSATILAIEVWNLSKAIEMKRIGLLENPPQEFIDKFNELVSKYPVIQTVDVDIVGQYCDISRLRR